MNRPLRIGDKVCIRTVAVATVSHAENTQAEPHKTCVSEDIWGNGARRVFHLNTPWQSGPVYVWPSEVHLANGVAERLYARQGKFKAELQAEIEAARAARAKRCPKKKILKKARRNP